MSALAAQLRNSRKQPVTRKFVDLSIFLENDVISDPPAFAPRIEYFTHENTYEQIAPFFPGLKKQDLPDGEGWRSSGCSSPPTTARTWMPPTTFTAP